MRRTRTGGYKIWNQEGIHFISFATVEWVDVFTRKEYREIVIDSIRHCQTEKGLHLYSWCITSNHVHLIASAKNNDLSEIPALFVSARSSVPVAPGRVFWSGGREVAGKEAMNFAQQHGKITLEMTTSGKVLETVGRIVPYKYTKPFWDFASWRFAKGASGTVEVFQNTSGIGLKSTWSRIEYKTLMENGVNIEFKLVSP